MRRFYIYQSDSEIVWVNEDRCIVKRKPWVCLGYVDGEKQLWKILKNAHINELKDSLSLSHTGSYVWTAVLNDKNKFVNYEDLKKKFVSSKKQKLPVYRKDPIPNLWSSYRFTSFYRSLPVPKDVMSQRDIFALRKEYPNAKISVQRAKRNIRNMPESWDDIPRSTNGNRNWKNFRKTQYKRQG